MLFFLCASSHNYIPSFSSNHHTTTVTIDTLTLVHDWGFTQSGASPMDTLPTEILVHIFIFANTYPTADDDGPEKLALVCHRWRDIIYSTPQLWTWLSTKPPFSQKAWARKLATYFERATPFDVNINAHTPWREHQETFLFLFAPLLPYWSRLKHIILNHETLQPSKFRQLPGTQTTLFLTLANRFSLKGAEIGMCGDRPSLRASRDSFPHCEIDLPFEVVQIQDYATALEREQFVNFISLLSHSPHLVELHLEGDASRQMKGTSYALPHPLIVLPHLERLFVSNSYLVHIVIFLLSLPALRMLTIEPFRAAGWQSPPEPIDVDWVGTNLRRMLEQSPTMPLVELKLVEIDLPELDYLFLFDRLRVLRSLWIERTGLPDDEFFLLTSRKRLPELSDLVLIECHEVLGDTALEALLWRRETTLRRVAIVECAGFGGWHMQSMRDAFGEGFVDTLVSSE